MNLPGSSRNLPAILEFGVFHEALLQTLLVDRDGDGLFRHHAWTNAKGGSEGRRFVDLATLAKRGVGLGS